MEGTPVLPQKSAASVGLSNTQAASDYARLIPILVGIVLLISCFYGLNAAGIFDRDEGLYTTAARQMVESGDWMVPRIGPDVRFAKPPLIYWLIAPSISVLGATPFAARLPSAICAALTALALWWWARRQGANRIGWVAALIYPLSTFTMGAARQATTDSLLTLCLTLTAIGWIEGYRRDSRSYLLMAGAAALSTLAKGAIGIVFPGAAFVLWLLLRRDAAALRRVPWIACLALYLLIVIPWHFVMWRVTGPTFFREYILHNHVQRFTGEAWGHVQPFWFYLPVLIIGLFPWSAFLPFAWWQSFRLRQSPRGELDCAWAMWAFWALIIVGFFSISKSKLPSYILPATPALAILIAARIDALWESRANGKTWEAAIAGVLGIVLGLLGIAVFFVHQKLQAQPGSIRLSKHSPEKALELLTLFTPFALTLGIIFLIGTIVILARWKFTPQVVGAAVLMNLFVVIVAGSLGLPVWGAYDIAPLHDLGRRTLPALNQGEPVVIYNLTPRRTSLRFVLGHTALVTETEDPKQVQQVLQRAGKGYILTTNKAVPPPLPGPIRQEATAREWVLWHYGTTS